MNKENAIKLIAEAKALAKDVRECKLIPGRWVVFNTDGPCCSSGHLQARVGIKAIDNPEDDEAGPIARFLGMDVRAFDCEAASDALNLIVEENDRYVDLNDEEHVQRRGRILGDALEDFAEAVQAMVEPAEEETGSSAITEEGDTK